MNMSTLPSLILVAGLVSPGAALAESEGRNVTLTNDEAGELVEAYPDGTTAELAYDVPQGKELCVTDVSWEVQGTADSTAQLWMTNTNRNGVTSYQVWGVSPSLNADGWASGLASFRAGPRISANGQLGLSASGVTAAIVSIYGNRAHRAERYTNAVFPIGG